MAQTGKLSKDYVQGLEDSAELILSALYSVKTLEDAKEQVKDIVGAAQRLKIDVVRTTILMV